MGKTNEALAPTGQVVNLTRSELSTLRAQGRALAMRDWEDIVGRAFEYWPDNAEARDAYYSEMRRILANVPEKFARRPVKP